MRRAVGFYWTLPVPWAGFHTLPADIEAAAAASKTIRYQMHLIRGWAADNRFDLIHEEVFIELQPDRPSEHIREPLAGLAEKCRSHEATLLYVNFSKVQGWRSNLVMDKWLADAGASIPIMPIWPDRIAIEGLDFDPHRHFDQWRKRWEDWRSEKGERSRLLAQEINALKAEGKKNAQIAATLNARRLFTVTGKPWTADSVRKLMKNYL